MDSLRDRMQRAIITNKDDDELRKQKYNESSAKRLSDNLQKKLQTSFIGSLSKFEESFGSLWGHSKTDSERTPEEKELHRKWLEVRNIILNNGNNQIRAMRNEVDEYTITWNRPKTVFQVKRPGSV